MKIKIILLVIILLVSFSKSSFSNDLILENKINKNLRCLICQGQSIYDSQSDFAESMKLVVKQKIKAGMSEEDIYSFFKIQYGCGRAPRPSGRPPASPARAPPP